MRFLNVMARALVALGRKPDYEQINRYASNVEPLLVDYFEHWFDREPAAAGWREVMDWLHRGEPDTGRPRVESRPPPAPPGVVKTAIRFEAAREPARQEWFIAGTERSLVRSAASRDLARIAYPVDGTVVALDPDIPPKLQRLPLKLSSAAEKDWRWRMDHQALGRPIGHAFWLPQPGHHRLSLQDASGRELDAVSFEVRAIKGR